VLGAPMVLGAGVLRCSVLVRVPRAAVQGARCWCWVLRRCSVLGATTVRGAATTVLRAATTVLGERATTMRDAPAGRRMGGAGCECWLRSWNCISLR